MKLKKVNYKSYTGYMAIGSIRAGLGDELMEYPHMFNGLDCLMDVVAGVECPFWGTVQNYDGVGMSAGILHNIAVMRDGTQGSLGPLLRQIELAGSDLDNYEPGIRARIELWNFLSNHGTYVAQDGKFRDTTTGVLTPGPRLRQILSGHTTGKASTSAELAKARRAAELFGEVFEHFHDAQKAYALQWMFNSNIHDENQATLLAAGHKDHLALRGVRDLVDAFWNKKINNLTEDEKPAMQAMVMYHSHSVNAPGKAINVLQRVMARPQYKRENWKDGTGLAFCKDLIKTLATTKYGAWHDTADGANRYDRTRKHMLDHPYFDETLMPKDFR
jgi:hypothetical protein